MGLKFFRNIGLGRSKEQYNNRLNHLETRRLETQLLREAEEVLQPPAVVACFEVNDRDLVGMLELIDNDSVRERFTIQQQGNPNQFIITRTERDWL